MLDMQHQRLVHLLNILASRLAYQSDPPALNDVFKELTEYAAYHFRTEENIWHQYLPADAWEAEHKDLHSSFAVELGRLKSEEGEKSLHEVVEDVLSFLTHWLAFHILESDKRMSRVALAMQSGLPLDQAKLRADQDMHGAMKALVETVLLMYDNLSARTLELMKEVVERQRAEAKLRLAANAMEHALEAICITDADANVIDVNPAFCQATHCSYEEVLGKNLRTLKSGLEDEKLSSAIWGAIAEKGHWKGEIWNRTKEGEIDAEWLTLSSIRNGQGEVSNYVGVFSSISHLIQQQQKLERMANHDALTGLPNRLLLSDRLELALAHAERTQDFLAVCYIDLDGFKPVNDSMGHAAGDYLLCEIAQRLLAAMRGNDTVARLGGDEFVILFGDLKQPEDCTELLDRLLQGIAQPVAIQADAAVVTASIGVAIFPRDAGTPDALLRHADQAMYQAKQLGKSRYRFYDSALPEQMVRH